MNRVILHFFSASAVVTPQTQSSPESQKEWLLAKGTVDVVDTIICQTKWHLLDTHLIQVLFCIVFRRHLSSRHPLYVLIESHCEGTVPVTELGVPSLINDFGHLHKLFEIGHTGSKELINIYYQKQHYDDSDFEILLSVSFGTPAFF